MVTTTPPGVSQFGTLPFRTQITSIIAEVFLAFSSKQYPWHFLPSVAGSFICSSVSWTSPSSVKHFQAKTSGKSWQGHNFARTSICSLEITSLLLCHCASPFSSSLHLTVTAVVALVPTRFLHWPRHSTPGPTCPPGISVSLRKHSQEKESGNSVHFSSHSSLAFSASAMIYSSVTLFPSSNQ